MESVRKLAELMNAYSQASLALKQQEFIMNMIPDDDVEARESMKQKLESAQACVDKYTPAIMAIAKAAEPYHDFLFGPEKSTFVA